LVFTGALPVLSRQLTDNAVCAICLHRLLNSTLAASLYVGDQDFGAGGGAGGCFGAAVGDGVLCGDLADPELLKYAAHVRDRRSGT